MTIFPGKVVNGRIEVENLDLPEGAEVSVYVPADDEVTLTPGELAELDAAIEEADRGGGVPAEEVLRELRALRDEEIRRRG
jgi:hypothetical protein